jgi:zinc protease
MRDEKLTLHVQLPVIIGAYHIPEGAHSDIYVLELIQQILSEGESSRLYKRLVLKEQLALAAGGVVFSHEDPGLFVTYAFYLPQNDATKIRQILDEEVRGLVSGNIDALELKKAQNQLASKAVFASERVASLATQMGVDSIVAKNPLRVFEAPKKYEAITIDDIKRVAGQYFIETNYSIVTLVPEGGAK